MNRNINIVDNKTPHLELPLPNAGNQLADDVERISMSFGKVDAHAKQTDAELENLGKTKTDTAAVKKILEPLEKDVEKLETDLTGKIEDEAKERADNIQDLESSITLLSPPIVTVPAKAVLGHQFIVGMRDGVIKQCETVHYLLTVNNLPEATIAAIYGSATQGVTIIGAVGDIAIFTAVAVDALGNRSKASTVQVEMIDLAIAPAVIVSPANGEQGVSVKPVITLKAMQVVEGVVDTAQAVRVQIATDKDFVNVVFDTGAEYTASINIAISTALERGGKYFSRAVWTGEQSGQGAWSSITTFSTFPAQVVGVCQKTEGVIGRDFQRIDVTGTELMTTPGFDGHPIYSNVIEQSIDGQRMIRFPKCFVSRETLATGAFIGKDARFLSDIALPGYEIHPAFLAKDGITPLDHIWLGKYQATSEASSEAGSQPGKMPLVSIDFPTMQNRCKARNTGGVAGFHMWNIHEWSLVQLMMLIEYSGTDMQNLIGRGHVDNVPSGVQNVDHTKVSEASWRGLTGIWGNIYQMCDGFRGHPLGYKLDMGKGLQQTTVIPANTNFYPNKMLNEKDADWSFKHLFIADPVSKGISADATYPDIQYLYSTSNDYCLYVGGHYSNGASAGLFFAYC